MKPYAYLPDADEEWLKIVLAKAVKDSQRWRLVNGWRYF